MRVVYEIEVVFVAPPKFIYVFPEQKVMKFSTQSIKSSALILVKSM